MSSSCRRSILRVRMAAWLKITAFFVASQVPRNPARKRGRGGTSDVPLEQPVRFFSFLFSLALFLLPWYFLPLPACKHLVS
ncbi:hypothetical protein BJX96DRAFT_10827 [Aspergillus floccosus]